MVTVMVSAPCTSLPDNWRLCVDADAPIDYMHNGYCWCAVIQYVTLGRVLALPTQSVWRRLWQFVPAGQLTDCTTEVT